MGTAVVVPLVVLAGVLIVFVSARAGGCLAVVVVAVAAVAIICR